ncbi:chromate efflux transporter [Hyphomonas atlantica corrig.]|uniref:chromate efflux transporter n=1 Tax=Hyphomonas atlantica TaxID=1280948 RepID=UPI002355A321|nr:chromate efflux transporter [Hyphomonas atlantica]
MQDIDENNSPSLPKPTLKELTSASFRVGCLGFGGPAGQIALMHRIFVDEKKWVDEDRYAHALNYCMLLPGPEAQQLATYVGWLLHGVRGGIIAGTLFIVPGALVVFLLSWIYMAAGHLPLVSAAFFGVKAAVFALVAEAMIRIGKRALKGHHAVLIAILSFVALFFWSAPFPLVILVAGLIGVVLSKFGPSPVTQEVADAAQSPSLAKTLATAAIWGTAWFAPVIGAFVALGPDHPLARVGRLFSTLAVVTFGGAYATLAYLKQQAVEVEGWLTTNQMLDGLGLAETTPGPLVLVNEYVGFVAGWSSGGFWLASLCALMAAWCTFAPSFVWIFAGAPLAERLRRLPAANAALKAVTAAVLGVIANLALWFAMHLMFRTIQTLELPGKGELPLPDPQTLDWKAALLCVSACVAVFRFQTGVLTLIIGSAVCGVALTLIFACT